MNSHRFRVRAHTGANANPFGYNNEYSVDYALNGQRSTLKPNQNMFNNRSNSNLKLDRRNSRNFDDGNILSQKRDLTPNSNFVRYMPIIPKKGVFNEWAAILKYNDEVDQEAERQELERKRKQKEQYRLSLGNQIKLQNHQS